MKTADKYVQARIESTITRMGVTPFKGETVLAYVNHDRWVADCLCNGAELVAPGETMLCGSCGAQHTVKFPGPKTRAKIEHLLGLRETRNRNWHPDETVSELEAQNIENGIWEDK